MANFNRRKLLLGAVAGAPFGLAAQSVMADDSAATRISEDQLGQLVGALGLQPTKKGNRFDFAFEAQMQDQSWALSMSTVLSQDGSSLWVMAWLAELPQSSNDVPRTALLRLLAANDQLGDGKFFAYIPSNRRFVMQRSVDNENITSAVIRNLLQDLGASVVENYPIWNTANWNGTPAAPVGNASAPQTGNVTPARAAVNDSKFEQPIRR